MSFEIEELTRLVEEERAAEEKVHLAEEEAKKIRGDAEKRAREILREAEEEDYLKYLEEKVLKEIARKKKALAKQYEKRARELAEVAEKKLSTAVSQIIEDVLEVEI